MRSLWNLGPFIALFSHAPVASADDATKKGSPVVTPAESSENSEARTTAGRPSEEGERAANESKEKPRRSGLLLLGTFGAGISGMTGFPNDVAKLGDRQYYAAGGLMGGGMYGGALMGAIASFINVGFFASHGSFAGSDWKMRSTSVGVRVEAFPLSGRPRLEDLGISLATGVGNADLIRQNDGHVSASVSQSFIGVGAFYEIRFADLLGGHAVFSPGIEADFTFGRTADARALSLAGRLAFYGGP